MYLIIGGDGKQYGPISGADLRRWVTEGRLSAQSMVKAESDAEFRTLSTFPEFADIFGVPPAAPGVAPVLAAGVGGREAASDKVRVPAIGLIISAILSLLFSLWGLVSMGSVAAQEQELDSMLSQMGNPQLQQFVDQFMHFFSGPFLVANYIFQMLIAILILVGALKMLKMKSYQFAYAAAIMAVLPCITPCCGWLLGLIFGIWAMNVLGKVKPYFS